MKHRIVLFVFAIAMMAGAASFANPPTGVPDMENSWVTMSGVEPGDYAVMFNVNNGGGASFPGARNSEGQVDATITLYLRDGNNDPIVNFPSEDMWLDPYFYGPSGYICQGGTNADAVSDANGVTLWDNPLRTGGWSEGPTVVMVSGSPLLSGDLNMGHNSPDINGDGVVNLTDVALFAADFYDNVNYWFRSDFHYDGLINLSDVGKLAQFIGAACP